MTHPATTIRRMIADRLSHGPVYANSMRGARSVLGAMKADDEITYVSAPGSGGRNMLVLTTRGVRRYGVVLPAAHPPEPSAADLMDALAERVSEGSTIREAGIALGITRGRTDVLWRAIKVGLGEQAR